MLTRYYSSKMLNVEERALRWYEIYLQTIPRKLLTWLCDGEMKKLAKGNKYIASSRLHMATGRR